MLKRFIAASKSTKDIALNSVDKKLARGVMAAYDTVEQSGTEVKMGLAGLALNALASTYDLDEMLGLDGIDELIDNGADVLLGGAAISVGFKLSKNFQETKVLEEMSAEEIIMLFDEMAKEERK